MIKQNKVLSGVFQNWIQKVFSILVALFLVVTMRFMNVNDRVVTLPLEVTLPDTLVAASLVPDTVEIVISGPDSVIYLVEPSSIKARADFSAVTAAGIVRVPIEIDYAENIYTRDGMTVSSKPSSVRILFEAPE